MVGEQQNENMTRAAKPVRYAWKEGGIFVYKIDLFYRNQYKQNKKNKNLNLAPCILALFCNVFF